MPELTPLQREYVEILLEAMAEVSETSIPRETIEAEVKRMNAAELRRAIAASRE